jgi:hypothetical protein
MNRQVKDTNLKRRIALLISICLIGIIILFRSYIVVQADHSHVNNGYGCMVCVNIQNAEYLLRQIGMATKTTLLISLYFIIALIQLSYNLVLSNHNSLVNLKIRMDN